MPSARPATAPSRRHSRSHHPATDPATAPRTRSRSPKVASRGLRGRVRWDRVGRVSLLVVLGVVAGVYVQQALAYLSVRHQAGQQSTIVRQLTRSNASLRAQQRSLNDTGTILRDARALGMVRVGEHPYEVTGLPSH